jgi:hypothetical protein
MFWVSFSLIGRLFQLYIHRPIAGFRNGFQDHRRVSEQFLETQVAIRKKKQAPRGGLLEGISKLVSSFIEASRNFNLISFT